MSLRRFRLLTFLWLLFICLLAVLFLLGVGVRNPTGQRHSSEIVDLTLSNQEKGFQGEDILARDLGVPTSNERSDNSQCICNRSFQVNQSVPPNCDVCSIYSSAVRTWRNPDFMTTSYIADSKNVTSLRGHNRDYEQLSEVATVAREVRRPLWIYVRVNSAVDQAFVDLAQSTGGDVIYYFRVLGYVDPLEQTAWLVIVVTCLGMATLIIWELGSPFVRISIKERIPTAPKTESIEPASPNVVRKAKSTTDATEDFMQRAKRWSHDTLDKENED